MVRFRDWRVHQTQNPFQELLVAWSIWLEANSKRPIWVTKVLSWGTERKVEQILVERLESLFVWSSSGVALSLNTPPFWSMRIFGWVVVVVVVDFVVSLSSRLLLSLLCQLPGTEVVLDTLSSSGWIGWGGAWPRCSSWWRSIYIFERQVQKRSERRWIPCRRRCSGRWAGSGCPADIALRGSAPRCNWNVGNILTVRLTTRIFSIMSRTHFQGPPWWLPRTHPLTPLRRQGPNSAEIVSCLLIQVSEYQVAWSSFSLVCINLTISIAYWGGQRRLLVIWTSDGRSHRGNFCCQGGHLLH